ncbi:hypothetical protein PAXRUDRAFT_832241 [Paxillus rubicundulus Ve08.2h10]|uniref:Uncharacterized protein n=1 Tax=Paxillus rubicundulus Ve08.2h10 TaxID=930991 RepID=A0A0D0DKX0_9AGAM|nr:hypothetical protein PAXRUDRAFT_832241 [Paxillus rubicundulus Ve08.2h10]
MVLPKGIPLDTAAVVSTVLEGIIYGFSILMFIGTMWALMQKRMNSSKRMVVVTCSLLLLSTAHMVIDIIRIEEGLVQQRDTLPGGPAAFFSDVTQWSFVYKNMLYMLQTLVGDGVVIYRCYVVWQSLWIIIVPLILWLSVAVTGVGCIYFISQATINKENTFTPTTGPWITAFLAATFFTNIFSTSLLAFRIWNVGKRVSSGSMQAGSAMWPVLRIILDAGMLYSFSLLVALVYFIRNRGHYVLIDMIMPIISLTFYVVIIRIAIAKSNSQGNTAPSSGRASRRGGREDDDRNQYPLKRLEVHVTQFTENEVDYDKGSWSRSPKGVNIFGD